MIKDLVSIVVPTYNDEPYLKNAINDLLHQTYSKIEIIIVNDGSTDKTAKILTSLSTRFPDKIKVFNKENGGTGSALNLGFKYAKGEFATWVSSDDRKNPEFIETLVTFLKENRDIELVVSAFESDYVGKIWRPYTVNEENCLGYNTDVSAINHDSILTGKSFIVDNWVDINNIQCHMGINYMFTMALKNRCGDYLTIPGEDYHMAVKMGLNTRVGYIDKILGKHCAPKDSLSVVNRNCVIEANRLTKLLISENHRPWYLSKIPKKMHVYLGCEKMSYLRAKSIASFKHFNPDWSVVLYSPKEIKNDNATDWIDKQHRCDVADYIGEDYSSILFDNYAIKKVTVDFSTTPLGNNVPEAHKADFLRWFLLYKKGGFWMDSDILFYRPITSACFNEQSNINADEMIAHYDGDKHPVIHLNSIGFLASKRNSNLYIDVYKMALAISKMATGGKMYQTYGSYILNQMFATFNSAVLKYPADKILNLDINTVYPIDFHHIPDIFDGDSFKKLENNKNIGLHWYGGSPTSQKYNNLYPRNENKNTIDKILEKIDSHQYTIGVK